MPELLSNFTKLASVYAPLSLFGLWRWTYWMVRLITARFYRPAVTAWPKNRPKPTVSLVTPVYNEDPAIFELAMRSWIRNGVTEIIAVIDKSNTRQILDYEKRYTHRKDVRCRLMVTPKPGKRAALCDGIEVAKGELIVLVDSDTIWDDKVLRKTLPYFLDESIGGATVGQRIQNPFTTSNVMFDILLWTRYREEVPFMLGAGKVFNTLSGRTAFYRREALLNPAHDNVHALRHEFFLGTRGVSGDDKRLTHLILEQGWHVAFVLGAWVYTPGLDSLKKFLKQRLRWTRNSWRADMRAMKRGWVWRHPVLAIFMLDRFVQPVIMLFGPIAFTFSVINEQWFAAVGLLIWWLVSRFVRLFGYFRAHPARLVYLPAYIFYSYLAALIKIYALATLLEHSWATRWHSYRMKTKRFLRRAFTPLVGAGAVVLFVVSLYNFVRLVHVESGATFRVPAAVTEAEFKKGEIDFRTQAPPVPPLPPGSILPTGVKSYTVQPGDTLATLAQRFNMPEVQLKRINGLKDPDVIGLGQTIIYFDPQAQG